METENNQSQMVPGLKRKKDFLQVAIVAGVILIVGVATLYAKSSIFRQNQSQQVVQTQQTKPQNQKIIYGDVLFDKEEPQSPTDILFYSLDPVTKEQKQLFTVAAAKIGIYDILSNIHFCSATDKMYVRTSKGVEEVDLAGNIRNLDFTNPAAPPYENWENYDTGFSLSPDCQRVAWSTTYYKYTNYKETGAVNEVVMADTNGDNKKVLLTAKKPQDAFGSQIVSWSHSNPNILYLSNDNWERNGQAGGLFSLDVHTDTIMQNREIPTQNIVWDISGDDNLVAHQDNFLIQNGNNQSYITNQKKGSTVRLDNFTNGKRKFSPDNQKLANSLPSCSGMGAEAACQPSLYISDLNGTNTLIASGVEFKDWLSNDSIVGTKDNKDLVVVDTQNKSENTLASTTGLLLFVGVSEK